MPDEFRDKAFYFEDYQVGDCFPSVTHEVTAEEIIAFAKQWDPQPWHIDEEAARQSIFGGLTTCSAHTFAIFSTISPKWLNGAIQQPIASLGFDEMRMLAPIFAGDTIQCESNIEMVRPSKSKDDRGIAASRCILYNQKREEVFSILATFLIRKRPG